MTAGVSRKKRWLKVLGFGFLGIAFIALVLPVWFPWVLRPVLARLGFRFDACERVGYTRFALTNVRGDFQNGRFQAERIVGLLPPEWVWRRYSRNSGEEPFLTAAHWTVHLEHAGKVRGSAAAPDSAFAVAEAIRGALPAWRSWLAHAQ